MFESLNNYKERYKEWLKDRPGSYPKEDEKREKSQNYIERYREWYKEKHGWEPEEGDERARLFRTEEEKD